MLKSIEELKAEKYTILKKDDSKLKTNRDEVNVKCDNGEFIALDGTRYKTIGEVYHQNTNSSMNHNTQVDTASVNQLRDQRERTILYNSDYAYQTTPSIDSNYVIKEKSQLFDKDDLFRYVLVEISKKQIEYENSKSNTKIAHQEFNAIIVDLTLYVVSKLRNYIYANESCSTDEIDKMFNKFYEEALIEMEEKNRIFIDIPINNDKQK